MAQGSDTTLREDLTRILMDNGAAVTKESIEALVRFIAIRDQDTVGKVIRDAEEVMRELHDNYYFGTRTTDNK